LVASHPAFYFLINVELNFNSYLLKLNYRLDSKKILFLLIADILIKS